MREEHGGVERDIETRRELLMEAQDVLDRAESDLVSLQGELRHRSLLTRLLRTLHEVKGVSRFLQSRPLESLMHAAESLLGGVQEGRQEVGAPFVAVLLSVVDAAREHLAALEEGTEEPDSSALTTLLTRVGNGTVSLDAREDQGTAPGVRFGDVLVESGRATARQVTEALQRQVDGDERRLGEILVEQGVLRARDVREMLVLQAAANPSTPSARTRVPEGLLDDLVAEGDTLLALAREHLESTPRCGHAATLELAARRVRNLLRMIRRQPVSAVWDRFPRFVHDLEQALGKRVRLEIEGAEVEVDRDVLQALQEPLTHLLRNAVDHCIEAPDVRVRSGKPREGVVRLRARASSRELVVEVSDDGAGIDVEGLLERAIERGLVAEDVGRAMSRDEAVQLVLLPGLSLSPGVSLVSGRGVGLDLVHARVLELGGRLEVHTEVSRGALFRIVIPSRAPPKPPPPATRA